jgi:hypothetical protein
MSMQYNRGLHRLGAILVAFAVSFGLISPLLAMPAGETRIPTCCRRDGKHGCAMKGMAVGVKVTSAPSVSTAGSKCPLYPAGKSTPVSGPFAEAAPSGASSSPLINLAAGLAQTEAQFRISFSRACQKRGPPSLLS